MCTGRYHPLLGTNVETRVEAVAGSVDEARRLAGAAEDAAVEEMVRLQAIFTVFDPDSELCRWRTGATEVISVELSACLAAAEYWWRVSGGAFHPASAALRARWLSAETSDVLPDDAELADIVAGLAALPFAVRPDRRGTVRIDRVGDCSGVDLNAIAKGYIVDRAVLRATECPGVVDVLVNAGGDLRHLGERVLRVGVEDPDDRGRGPVAVIALAGGALATSGFVHRGFRVSGTWYGHVLDPRSGWPVHGRPSTTVRAVDAVTADAVATVANVLDWPETESLVDGLPGVAVLSVDPDGGRRRTGSWAEQDLSGRR